MCPRKANQNYIPMHRTQLFIPNELQEALAHEADADGISLSELIRQISAQYLNKNSRQRTEAGMSLLLEMTEMAENINGEKKEKL